MTDKNEVKAKARIRQCWNCGGDMGLVEDRHNDYMSTCGGADCEREASNAALIAAAPDLLEALDQILDDMGEGGLSCCQAAKDQARAALAKATAK